MLELLLSEHHDQALGWDNLKAKLRWGVFLFSCLFKMLSDHQHLTHSMSRPQEGLHTRDSTPAGANLLKVLGHQGVGPA